jgi:hypothetical protein
MWQKTQSSNQLSSSGVGGLGVSALASGTQVRGFKPGRSRRIFQGEKIISAPSFGREVKPWVPSRWFTACKRSLGVSWKSASRQNWSAISRPHSSGFGYQDRSRIVDARDDWRWKLERLKQGKSISRTGWGTSGGISHRALQNQSSTSVLLPKIPRHLAWQFLSLVSQTLRPLLPQSHDCSCYVNRPILAPSPLWLHKHNYLRAHDFAHSSDLRHQPRLDNITCAWSWRLCGTTPAIP